MWKVDLCWGNCCLFGAFSGQFHYCPNQPNLPRQLKTHLTSSMFPILDTNLCRNCNLQLFCTIKLPYNSGPFCSQITAFHFSYKNWSWFQNIQFEKEELSINMLRKILAFFILPCLVISFKMDMKPAFQGNLSF